MASAQRSSFSGQTRKETNWDGSRLSARQQALLFSYLLNLWRGPEVVRQMMVHDFRSCVDLGASTRATDLLFVLQQFLSVYPEARLEYPIGGGKGSHSWSRSIRRTGMGGPETQKRPPPVHPRSPTVSCV